MLSFALFAELGYFHFIFQNESTLWKLLSFMQSLLGKGEGRKSKGKLCFFDTLQDVLLSLCLLYKHYILRLFIIQQPPVLGIFIFSPLKNSLSVGEMDLWLLLSGSLMHSSILEALFWEVCFLPFELGKRPMKSAVQSTPIHNWERFKT